MALGSDVRDILELEGADEKDEFITKEAFFGDTKKVLTVVDCSTLCLRKTGHSYSCDIFETSSSMKE